MCQPLEEIHYEDYEDCLELVDAYWLRLKSKNNTLSQLFPLAEELAPSLNHTSYSGRRWQVDMKPERSKLAEAAIPLAEWNQKNPSLRVPNELKMMVGEFLEGQAKADRKEQVEKHRASCGGKMLDELKHCTRLLKNSLGIFFFIHTLASEKGRRE